MNKIILTVLGFILIHANFFSEIALASPETNQLSASQLTYCRDFELRSVQHGGSSDFFDFKKYYDDVSSMSIQQAEEYLKRELQSYVQKNVTKAKGYICLGLEIYLTYINDNPPTNVKNDIKLPLYATNALKRLHAMKNRANDQGGIEKMIGQIKSKFPTIDGFSLAKNSPENVYYRVALQLTNGQYKIYELIQENDNYELVGSDLTPHNYRLTYDKQFTFDSGLYEAKNFFYSFSPNIKFKKSNSPEFINAFKDVLSKITTTDQWIKNKNQVDELQKLNIHPDFIKQQNTNFSEIFNAHSEQCSGINDTYCGILKHFIDKVSPPPSNLCQESSDLFIQGDVELFSSKESIKNSEKFNYDAASRVSIKKLEETNKQTFWFWSSKTYQQIQLLCKSSAATSFPTVFFIDQDDIQTANTKSPDECVMTTETSLGKEKSIKKLYRNTSDKASSVPISSFTKITDTTNINKPKTKINLCNNSIVYLIDDLTYNYTNDKKKIIQYKHVQFDVDGKLINGFVYINYIKNYQIYPK